MDWLTMPIDGAPGSRRETREHAKHGGLATTRRTEQADDLPGINGDIGGRDDLNAAAIGLRIKLFKLPATMIGSVAAVTVLISACIIAQVGSRAYGTKGMREKIASAVTIS